MKDLEQLRADIEVDEDLRNKLLACNGDEEAVNAIFAEAGYDVTFADTMAYAEEQMAGLTDEELDACAGGMSSSDAMSWGLTALIGSGLACLS